MLPACRSKPLAALGQPHLTDTEAPWPAPFSRALSLRVFLGHYFLTPDPWVLCDCDGQELCYQYQVIYLYCPLGWERNDCSLVTLWIFKDSTEVWCVCLCRWGLEMIASLGSCWIHLWIRGRGLQSVLALLWCLPWSSGQTPGLPALERM